MGHKVFISVGSAATSKQREVAESIFKAVETAGLSPRQMDRNEWSSEQPLRAIRRVLEECHGTVVIAFTRSHFSKGAERQKDESSSELIDVKLPTVWNQIESAMSYTNDLPLLVIAEKGLREEGLLEDCYDWKVFRTSFDPGVVASDEFVGILRAWSGLVEEHSVRDRETAGTNPANQSIASLWGQLTVPQLWSFLTAVLALLSGVGFIAFRLGAGAWPWN